LTVIIIIMAQQLDLAKTKAHYYIAQLDKELAKHPLAIQFEKTTHVPKAYAVLGSGSLFVILLFFNIAGPLLTNFLGWIYPAYASFKALETKETADDTHWLTYWVIYGLVSTLEYFSNWLTYYIPFFYILKAAFLIWLYSPQFRGAQYLYITVVRPYLRTRTNWIDDQVSNVKNQISNALQDESISAKRTN